MPHRTGEETYNFKDMTSQTVAVVLVLERTRSDRYEGSGPVVKSTP